MTQSQPDCLSCGACCFGGHDRYIRLFPEDLDRALPDHAWVQIGEDRFMRMSQGHCAQLTPLPGGGLACAVYEQRPTACRAFRAGSFECGRSRAHRMAEADAIRLPPVTLPETPEEVPAAEIIAALPGFAGPRGRA